MRHWRVGAVVALGTLGCRWAYTASSQFQFGMGVVCIVSAVIIVNNKRGGQVPETKTRLAKKPQGRSWERLGESAASILRALQSPFESRDADSNGSVRTPLEKQQAIAAAYVTLLERTEVLFDTINQKLVNIASIAPAGFSGMSEGAPSTVVLRTSQIQCVINDMNTANTVSRTEVLGQLGQLNELLASDIHYDTRMQEALYLCESIEQALGALEAHYKTYLEEIDRAYAGTEVATAQHVAVP